MTVAPSVNRAMIESILALGVEQEVAANYVRDAFEP
jgi:hypothetical protein